MGGGINNTIVVYRVYNNNYNCGQIEDDIHYPSITAPCCKRIIFLDMMTMCSNVNEL